MTLDSLRLIRNILLRTVVISFVLYLTMFITTFAFWNTWTRLTSQWFHIPVEALGPLMLNFFAEIKFYNIFVLLAPALALHWTVKREMQDRQKHPH